jgi:hypothetical protein
MAFLATPQVEGGTSFMEVETEKHSEHEKKHLVHITIDGKAFEVPRGEITVAALKQLAGIPAGYELEEVKHGKLVPLKDDAKVEIKGGEQFVSHPRDGASS